MAFDAAELDTKTRADEGVPMPVLNMRTGQPFLNDDGTPVTITLHGPRSDRFQRLAKEFNSEQAKLTAERKPITQEMIDEQDILLLIGCTSAWTVEMLDDQPFPCTPQNIEKFWRDPRFFDFRVRASQWLGQAGNFMREKSRSSKPSPDSSSRSIDRSPRAEA